MLLPTDRECPYCTSLPAVSSRKAGKPSHCPLCKEELVAVEGAATPYRLAAAGESTSGYRPGRRLLTLAALAAVGLVASWVALAGLYRPGERPAATAALLAQPESPRLIVVELPPPSAAIPPASPARRAVSATQQVKAPAEAPAAPLPLSREAKARPYKTLEALMAKVAKPDPFVLLARDFPDSGTRYPKGYVPVPANRFLRCSTEAGLVACLCDVHEVALDEDQSVPDSPSTARSQLLRQAKAIQEQNKNHPDTFVASLVQTRRDLTGLPLRLGKDCTLQPQDAGSLGMLSRAIRASIDEAGGLARPFSSNALPEAPSPAVFWSKLWQLVGTQTPQSMSLPALEQMLQGEHASLRLSLVDHLGEFKERQVSLALARRAVFDPEPEVRLRALDSLKARPAEDYQDFLVASLRYPWAPVAQHAAAALTVLRPKGLVPQLVDLLDRPDPDAPFMQVVNSKEMPVVRELVRINHHRNCLLCHAPSFDAKDVVRGTVPVPGTTLSTSATRYYANPVTSDVFVRADVTYLRQDFSVVQKGSRKGVWPEQPRYDFLVRTRPVTEADRPALRARELDSRRRPQSPYWRAILYALCGLTGEYPGATSEAWQHLLRTRGDLAVERGPSVAASRE